jgi:hypothetical protein
MSNETMQKTSVKEQARRMVEELPDDSTWEYLMHIVYVRQTIEAGLADSENGRTCSVDEFRSRFGLHR